MSLRRALLHAVKAAGPAGTDEVALYADLAEDHPLLIPDVLRKHLRRLHAARCVTVSRPTGRPWRVVPTVQGRRCAEGAS